MTRRLSLPLLALVALSGGLRLIAQDVVLVPGTISGSISVGNAVVKQATVYAYPASGGSTSSITVVPNAASATYSLTVSVPPSGQATYNALADIYTDESRDYLRTTTSQVSVSAATPGQLNFTPAVGFVNASITVSGGTLSSAYVYASQNGSYAYTSATSQYGWTFPTMPGNSINLGGTAYLTDGRQINFTSQTVSVASGQTLNVSFSVTAPTALTNAIGGTIDFTGSKTVSLISAFASGPTSRWINQSPPPANQEYLLDGLGTGQYTVGVYAYTNNNQAYLYMPDSAFSPGRTVTVGQTPVTVNVSAPQAFINSTPTLTGAPTLSPYLSSGQIQYMGQSQTPAAGGQSYAQMNGAARTFESVVAPGTWRQSYVNLNFYRSAAPSLSASFSFYDNRTASNVTLAEGETRTPAIDLALGEVTITMSVAGGQTLSNPRLNSAYCTYTVGGSTLWQFYPYASSGASNVTQGQVTFVGPAGTCTVTPAMTVNGSSVALSPITLTIVPGTSQVIDVGGPTLTMTSPAAETVVATPVVTVSGKATDDVGVDRVTINGVNVTLTSTGNQSDGKEVQFQTTVSGLQLGPNTITTVASDATAKNNTDARTVYYDTAAPSLVFTPADGTTTLATTITVSGTADDDAGVSKITVNGANVSFSSTNNAAKPKEVSFTTSVPLVAGPNPITVAVTDISTRTTSATHTVTRTQQAPTSLSVLGSAIYGFAATYTATLTSNGTPVAGQSVHFTSGFGNADATTGANGVATASGISVAGVNAGSYALGASFAGDSSYAASNAVGSLTVIKAPAEILLSRLTQTYTGSGVSPFVATNPANLTGVSITYEDGTHNLPVNAGTHHLVATLTNANYVAPTVEADLVITKATPTISAVGGTFTYDGQPHAASATVTGAHGEILGPVSLSYSGGAASPPAQLFAAATQYSVGRFPFGTPAIADFDGDGKLDAAIANYSDNSLSILKGDGTGRFTVLGTYPVGPNPVSVAAADFDADGHIDLAISFNTNFIVEIFLGRGDGTFRSGSTTPGVYVQNVIRAIDVNRDGKPDLISSGDYAGAVLNLGNGNGTFQSPVQLGPSNLDSLGVAAGDFNGDGLVDIAVANRDANYDHGSVAVLVGRGDGTFAAPLLLPETGGPFSVETADVNGDGKLDVISANHFGHNLTIWLGNGDGTFRAPTHVTAGNTPLCFAVADVNRDGRQDLVVDNSGDNTVSVLLGRGDGTFDPPLNYSIGSVSNSAYSRGVALADLDGDGALDLVVANSGGNSVSVLLQSANASGSSTPPVHAGSYIVTASYASSTNYTSATASATLTIGKAPLSVTATDKTKAYGSPNPAFTATETGFVTGESAANLGGALSFTTTATSASAVGTYAITPGGLTSSDYSISFVNGTLTISPASATISLGGLAQTYDGTAKSATATTSPAGLTGVSITYNSSTTPPTGAGSYAVVASLTNANYTAPNATGTLVISKATPTMSAAGGTFTYDGQAHPATALATGMHGESLGPVTFTYSSGTSGSPVQFAPAVNYAVGNYPMGAPVVADFDGDGKFDLAVANNSDGTISILKGDGTVRFSPLATYTVDQYPSSIAAADFNGDGRLDLAVASGGYSNTTRTLLGNGDGTFRNGPTANWGYVAILIRALDVNRDGKVDLLTVGYYHGAVLILGNGDGTFQSPRFLGPSNQSTTGVAAGDLNGDGIVDIAVPASLTESNPPNDIMALFFGNADGTFQPAVSIPDSRGLAAVEIADLNHDAKLDLITGSWAGLAVRLGNGDGTFGSPTYLPAGPATMWITVTDVSRDGALDILATNNDRSVIVLLGRGDGTFEAAASYTAGSATRGVSVADLDGDGALDLIVTNLASNNVSVLLQSANASGSSTPPVHAGSYIVTASYASSTNYTSATASATLTIGKAPLSVTATDKTKAYGSPNPAFTATESGFVTGESAANLGGTLTFATTATPASGVGTYAITPAGLTSTNYTISFVGGVLTIDKAPLTVRADDKTQSYGAAAPPFTASYSGFVMGQGASVLGGALTFTSSATATSNVGTYGITPSGVTSGNYAISFVDGLLTIDKAALAVRADNKSRLYGAANPTLTATYSGFVLGQGAGVLGGTLAFATPATDASDVGTYVITPSGLTSGNYAVTFVDGALTIEKAPLTVRADDKSRLYGTSNPPFSATYSGFVLAQSATVLGGTLSFATPAAKASDVGTYVITPSGLTSGNYAIAFLDGILTITPASLSITAASAERRYGAENPTFTGTVVGIQNDDPITGSYTTDATPGSAVGTYVITPALSDGNTGRLANYEITSNNGALTITKAPLTVTANDATREYGLANPELSASYSGLVAGDQPAVLGGALAFTTSASPASSVGPYAISTSGVTSGNYDITFVDGTLSVTTASLVISANDKARRYGGENPAFSGAVTGLRNDDPITLAFATPATTTSGVGDYVITPSAVDPGGRLGNYSLSTRTGTLQVTRAALTVRAIDQSRRYGAPNPAFDVVHDGLVAGDTAAALHGTLAVTTAADQRSNVGAYPIQPAGVFSPNYDITLVDGTLTITQAEAVMAIAAAGPFTYDAAPHGTTTSARGALAEDLGPITLTYNGSESAPIAAGSYTVVASYAGGLNYAAGTITASIVINRAPLDVTADDVSRTYGQENPALTVSFAGLVGGETTAVLSGTLMFATPATQSSGAWAYAIASSGLTSANYNIRYHDGVLTVTPAPLTVTANDAAREFGMPNPVFSATFTGFILGETPDVLSGALSFTTPAGLDSPVGVYLVIPAGVGSPNYQISFGAGTLRIVDTTAPEIRPVTPSQTVLWPPNHQLVPVTLAIDATDAASSFSCRVTNVSSSEPDNGLGDGDTAGDTQITGTDSVVLRAERAGQGPGRIYEIQVECRDAFENTSRDTVAVTVPKSQGK